MANSNEMITFLDLLDLDEELVDSRLKSIMERSNHSNTQLSNALHLIQYKNLINLQDKTDCENSEEFDFLVKLIKNVHLDIIENVCKITNSVLNLNANTLVSNSQHLLQQLLSSIDLSQHKLKASDDDNEQSRTLLYFKVCDSLLDVVIQKELKIELLFLEVPLEKAICHYDDKVKIHFITSTVPKLFKGIVGYNILDNIWNYVKELKDIDVSLKVLSCLSDYYLPAVDIKAKIQLESDIVYQNEFWRIVLSGLMSTDFTYRKISAYLAKRAMDYLSSRNRNIEIKLDNTKIFSWDNKDTNVLRKEWDNFFILMDSLEEKQSNIVLPSLQLFDAIKNIHKCWLNCAFNLGLKHDNSQVRLKCVEYQLKRKVHNATEATVLIQALDDINFYENIHDIMALKEKFKEMLKNEKSLVYILEAIPRANLSHVPLFHMTDILAQLDFDVTFTMNKNASEIITEIMKVPCNIIALRKAVLINVSHFVGNCCKGLDWKVLAKVFSLLQLDTKEIENAENPLVTLLENNLTPNEGDSRELFKYATNTLADIDFGLLYLEKHIEHFDLYNEIIEEKIEHVVNIVSRQYSNKLECFNDVLILLKIFNKCKKGSPNEEIITKYANKKVFETILQYILHLLTSNTVLAVDECKSLFCYLKYPDIIVTNEDYKELYKQLYKSSVILLKDLNIELEKAALSMFVIHSLSHTKTFIDNYGHEMLDIEGFLNLARIFGGRETHKAQSIGRLKNIFYEKHVETVNIILNNENITLHMQSIVDYVDYVIECGGYGCLYWILKIVNKILKELSLTNDVKFDINQFIKRMWREIEELKTNNQNYSPCMEEFACLITHKALLDKPEFNNAVILYCNKIIDNGIIKNNPLYYLARELNTIEISEYGHLIFILGELLLYCPVSRKDQRIIDNLTIDILKNTKYGIKSIDVDMHFNFEIQYVTISTLSRIHDSETLDIITSFIKNKIDDIFKHKVRYHGNSQLHRTIQTGLQHLVFILLLNPNVDSKRVLNWCLHLLGKLPHQQSVRICLEWYITICFCIEHRPIDDQMLDLLKSKKVPVLSQFIIMYWLLKHKIASNKCSASEYEFVLDTLLSYTMGHLFNVRLHAQYLSTKLYELNTFSKGKYEYTIDVIDKTLTENAKDRSLIKLKEDYFVNEFDVIENLTPYFLYNSLPKLCDSNNNEIVDQDFVTRVVKTLNRNITLNDDNKLKKEWVQCRIKDEELIKIELKIHAENKAVEEMDKMGTLQKKYVPWKNMSDVNVYETTRKRESPSDLILVASLIDKLPNLGGMARSSEVFGVKTYVIDSLRHLQDKQFQGLSVSAERWIDIEEVRPGQPLKDYLNRKKAEGYAVVAAEQTSTGSKLQSFKFPRKTLLLLGHEKEGIPCDLLPMMDYCVEIPQQGFVRSLNVHVTAAIFVWEYARQNLL